MAYYNWEDKKPKDNRIIIEGVDLNDREAVENKYKELKKKRGISTFVCFLAFSIIIFVAFDFWNSNFNGGEPIIPFFAVKEEDSNKGEVKTYKDVLHASLLDYFNKKKLINDDFDSFVINSYVKDAEDEEEGYIDYYMDITYECKSGGSSCFKTLKERINQNNLLVYVSVNKSNMVTEVFTFKNEGLKYDELVVNYTEKLKNYMIKNNLIVGDNLRTFKVELLENKGKYTYNGVLYADSYVIKVSYMCVDNTDTCVTRYEDGKNVNLAFEALMFLDENDEVGLVDRIVKN